MSVYSDRANGDLRPHLRAIEVERVTYQNGQYFLLQDSTGVAAQQMLVPLRYGALLALTDGTRTLAEVVEEARLLYGTPFDEEEAEALYDALGEAGMLEGERFAWLHAQAVAEWRALPSRPMALAGHGYPADRGALWRHFQNLLESSDVPEISVTPAAWERGVALLSPHIDYPRGGAIYADVWKSMGGAVRDADVAVILATDHKGDDPLTFTRLDYATPYGVLPTDTALRDAMVEAVGEARAYAGELRHRNEHSIELVANWLHHMRQGDTLPIVSVLVGSLHRYGAGASNGASGHTPDKDPVLEQIVQIIRDEMGRRRVLVVASGDLAHVGPAFGSAPLDESDLEAVRKADARLLGAMKVGSAADFFEEIRRVRNRNNVCGVAPIYLAMRASCGTMGRALGYAVAPADEAGTSVVTIAGVAFV